MTARRVGAAVTILAMLACIIPTLALPIIHGEMLGLFGPDFGLATSFSLIGAFLLLRSPVTNLAVIMCVQGVFSSMTCLTLVGLTLAQESGPPHGIGLFAAWLNNSVWIPGVTLLVPLILLFPDGRLAATGWRWLIVVAGLGGTGFIVIAIITEHSLIQGKPESFAPNPTAVVRSDVLQTVGNLLPDFVLVALVISIISVVLRRRGTQGVERSQFTSLILGLAVSVVVLAIVFGQDNPIATGPVLFIFGLFAILPVSLSIAVAVLRYRLYEIDKVVSRTVTYALVLAVLAAVYVTVLATLAQLVPDHYGSVGVAAATLLVSALAAPLTRRVRHGVDRRFDRAHVDAQRVTATFAARLRARPERGDVPADLLDVVHRTVAPSHASVWLVDRH